MVFITKPSKICFSSFSKGIFLVIAISMATASNASAADIEAILDTSDGTSGFSVQKADTTEVIRVESDGQVGVGQSTPTTILHVNSAAVDGTGILTLQNTGGDVVVYIVDGTPEASITANIGDLAFDRTNGAMYVKTTSNGDNVNWKRLATGSGEAADIALSNLASVAVNTDIISDTDITDSLGSAAVAWLNTYTQYLRSGTGEDLVIDSATGTIDIDDTTIDLSTQTVDVTLNAAADALNFDSNTLSIDASSDRVGIGTAAPLSDLHVGAGGTLNDIDGTNDIYVQGDIEVDGTIFGNVEGEITGTIDANLTQGSVAFGDAAGAIVEDNDELFWDDTNDLLAVGTNASISGKLHVDVGSTDGYSGIYINADDADQMAMNIDGEQTTAQIVRVSAAALTTGTAFLIGDADSLTTGKIASFTSNSSSNSARDLVEIKNDNAAATGTTVLSIDQDSTGTALSIDSESTASDVVAVDGAVLTSGDGVQIAVDTDALTTGRALRILGTSTGSTEVFSVDGSGGTSMVDDLTVQGGDVTIGDATTAKAGAIILHDNQGDSFTTTIQAGDDVNTSFTLTLPATAGSSAQVLQTDGSGNLSWGVPTGGTGGHDLEGGVLTIDDDDDTTLQASIDDTIVIAIAGADQFTLVDGAMIPSTTNDIDLGKATRQFKDLHIDGTANIDSLVADTAAISGGTIEGAAIDSTTIGASTAAAGTFTNVAAETGTVTIGTAAANPGSIVLYDGVGDSTATTIKTAANIDGSYTLTLPTTDGSSSQVLTTDGSGNLSWGVPTGGTGGHDLEGGVLTIDDDDDTTLQASIDDTIVIAIAGTDQFTLVDGAMIPTTTNDIDLGKATRQFKDLHIDGTANIDSLVADTAAISGGTIQGAAIDSTAIGGTTPAAGTFTNLAAETGTVTIGTAAANAGTLVIYDGVGDSTATTIKTAANIDGSYTLTLPTTDGSSSQVLTTDGSGNLSWGVPTGGTGGHDLEGGVLTIDDDDDTTLQASIDDTIVIAIAGTDQFTLVDGAMIPTTTNDIDLGKATRQFKDLHIDGTANIDSLVADTAAISGGTIQGAAIDSTAIGGTTPAAGTFTNLAAETGTVTIGTAAANAGTLVIYDGVGDSTATTIKTAANIDGSFTLTLPDDDGTVNQVLMTDGAGNLIWSLPIGGSGAYDLEGGVLTIDDDDDTTLQASIDDTIVIAIAGTDQFTLVDGAMIPTTDNDIDLGKATREFKDLHIDGTANIDALVADTADINAGTIDGATIGGASAAAGTFTNLAAETGTVTIGTAAANAGTLVLYDGVGDSTATTIKTAANIDGSYTLTLPTTDGSSSQVLTTDGAGNLTWGVPTGGTGGHDLEGGVLTIDDDDDTTLQASIDDTIVIAIAGTDQFTLVDGAMIPTTTNDIDLGKATRQFKDLHIDGTANIDDLAADLATFSNTGLHILDTDDSHDLIIAPNSDLTADRTLTITTDDANRSVTLSGNLTVESASLVNQDLTTDASPTFANATLTAGVLTAGTAAANPGSIVLYDGVGDSTATTIKTATNIDGSFTLTLPTTDGSSSQVLTTDGAGNLTWGVPTGGTGGHDLEGGVLTIDDDDDTTLQASIDDTIVIAIAGTDQFTLVDGAMIPTTDNDIDLGKATREFKDLHIDGTANIDALVADTADINAGTIDGATIGGASAAAGTFTNVAAETGTVTIGTAAANAGTLVIYDGVGDSTATTIKTAANIDGSYTLTLPTTDGSSSQVLTTDGSGNLSWGVPTGGTGGHDLEGGVLTIDDDDDTTLQASIDDTIVIAIAGTDQFTLVDGAMIPTTTNDIDLGKATRQFKDLHIDGTANIDSLVADTAAISGGTIQGAAIDSTAIGGTTPAAGTFTNLAAETGTVTIGTAAANAGTLVIYDGVGDSTATTIKTAANIDGSFTLTLPDDDGTVNQVLMTDGAGNLIWSLPIGGSGAYDLEGGVLTIDDDDDTTLQASIDDTIVIAIAGTDQFTLVDGAMIPTTDNDIDLGKATREFKDLHIDGTANIDALVADTADINAGTIDGATIGGASAAAGTFTNLAAETGTVTIGTAAANAGTLVLYDGVGDSTATTIKTAANIDGSYTLTLPTTDGSSSQVLTTDGAGNLTWGVPTGGTGGHDLEGGVLTIDDDDDTTLQASIDDTIVIAIAGTDQFTLVDGAMIPTTTNDIDLGKATRQFKDLHIDGTANIDDLAADLATFSNTGLHILDTDDSHDLIIAPNSDLTADRTLTITTDDANRSVTLSGNLTVESASLVNQDLTTDASPTFANATLTAGVLTAGTAAANPGSIVLYDGVGDSTATTIKTATNIDGSFTLTLPTTDGSSSQVLTTDGAGNLTWGVPTGGTGGHDLEGGVLTIDDDDDTTLQASIDDTIVIAIAGTDQFTLVDGAMIPTTDNDIDLGKATREFKDLHIDGTANIDALVADTADINAGTIDGATIGGASAAAGTFTNVAAETGTVTIGTAAANAGTLVIYDGVGDSTATTIKTAANIDGSYTLTLPTTDGSSSQVLTTDGSGNLSWGVPTGGTGGHDLEGGVLTIDDDDDTTLQASIDDTIVIAIAGTDQFTLVDGAMIPTTTNDIDLGKATRQFKDLHIDGTANIDSLVADTAAISGGTIQGAAIDSTAIGGTTPAAGTFTNLAAETGTVTIGTAAANAGTLVIYDGVGDSTATTIKTAANIDGSFTLTLPDDDGTVNQVLMTDGAGNLIWSLPIGGSGAYDLEGGVLTIDDDDDTTLQASIDDTIVIAIAGTDQFTLVDGAMIPTTDNDIDLGKATREFKDLHIDGTANIDALVADTADINAGTIDGATIGGASAAAGTFTNLAAETGTVTIGTAAANAGTLVLYDGVGDSTATTIKTAANIDGSYTLTLPTTDGSSSQVLTTDGAGNLTWGVPTGGTGGHDLEGGVLTIDDDDDTTLQASIDDTIVIAIAGTDQFTLVDGAMIPTTTNDIDLGKATRQFKDLHIDGTANIDDLVADLATFSNTGLHILDTDDSHDLIIAPNSDLTADRTLTITTDDANRSVTLSGNLTVESASLVNQDLTTDASPTFAEATVTAGNITFGTAGGNAGTIVLHDSQGDSFSTSIKAADDINESFTLTLPDDGGTASQFLQTDGAGNLSWSVSAGQSGAYDLAGGVLTIDDDNDTTLQASIDDTIVIAIAGTDQFTLVDGAMIPTTDNDIDLGKATREFKDLHIDGTANIDALVADTADINAGTIDGATIGGASAAAGTFTNLAAETGTVTIGTAAANAGTLVLYDGVGDSTATTIKTAANIDGSYTLTLPDDDGTSSQFLHSDRRSR